MMYILHMTYEVTSTSNFGNGITLVFSRVKTDLGSDFVTIYLTPLTLCTLTWFYNS